VLNYDLLGKTYGDSPQDKAALRDAGEKFKTALQSSFADRQADFPVPKTIEIETVANAQGKPLFFVKLGSYDRDDAGNSPPRFNKETKYFCSTDPERPSFDPRCHVSNP